MLFCSTLQSSKPTCPVYNKCLTSTVCVISTYHSCLICKHYRIISTEVLKPPTVTQAWWLNVFLRAVVLTNVGDLLLYAVAFRHCIQCWKWLLKNLTMHSHMTRQHSGSSRSDTIVCHTSCCAGTTQAVQQTKVLYFLNCFWYLDCEYNHLAWV